MPHEPSSMILFLTICSLTKSTGGEPQYSDADSIASRLPVEMAQRLLIRREELLRLVRDSEEVEWQGVPLSKLEFNRDLTSGPDFGGRRTATYLPALDRYQGRFFQALGPAGKQELRASNHHVLFLSGLYGLLGPLEPIQLYSCPLKYPVADLWVEDDLLTDVLCEYIRERQIARIIDMTAMDAYRKLVDWERVLKAGTDVLHVVDSMAAGDYALTSFGRLLGSKLLQRSEADLVALEPGTKLQGVIFQSTGVEQRGLPSEFPPVQPRPISDLPEGLRGGIPEPADFRSGVGDGSTEQWQFAITRQFERDVRHRKDIYPQILRAAIDICRHPLQADGKTIKRLSNSFRIPGAWRYRVADNYRIVYVPDHAKHTVVFHEIKPRGDPELY